MNKLNNVNVNYLKIPRKLHGLHKTPLHATCLRPWIKLLTSTLITQSHTNNGFFKLVEALLQIYSCFFSHSMELYVAYHYQQSHCLAQRFEVFFLATLFLISARFTRSYAINFLIYHLHNVGYILKQEGILQRPTILFIHCKIFFPWSATTTFNAMVDVFMEEGLVIEYILYQVQYEIVFYSLPFTVCYFMLISSLSKHI